MREPVNMVTIKVTPEEYDKLSDMLDREPRHLPRLAESLRAASMWEES